nr:MULTISPECIES: TetR family transcriptional regulator [unclassified Frankia]
MVGATLLVVARNNERRTELADAGLAVLAREGARGLTHRAVDREAGVPIGTSSNYFRSRADLFDGIVRRIGERLAPEPAVLERLGRREPSRELFADYISDIVRRMTTHRDLTIALFELRLEAARRPEVAQRLTPWFRDAFAADVAFNTAAGLPGDAADIALFHYAIDGLMLDRLTVSIDPGSAADAVARDLVDRLLPEADCAS